jgi:hypothetical protein
LIGVPDVPPVPSAIQSTFVVDCQGQLDCTVYVPSPPPTCILWVVGVIPKVQSVNPSCVTVTCCSPMLITPARATAPGLVSTVKLTPASPGVPEGPDVMWSHGVFPGTVAL